MPDRYAIKTTLLSVIIMGITSAVALVILGVFTYLLKWQAPQAQLGITLTYIISGVLGGFLPSVICESGKKKNEVKNTENSMKTTLMKGITQSAIYMVLLLSISIMISTNENWDIGQIVLIWILLICSNALGIFLGTAIRRRG